MNCPLDGSELLITERQGVEIDYCPKCRGIWLDRGELDKLIERADAYDRRERGRDSDDNDRDDYRKREDYGGREQYQERDAYRGNDQPRQEYPQRSPGVDIAGMVGDALKKKMSGRQHDEHYGRKKKKDSFLGDLFDF